MTERGSGVAKSIIDSPGLVSRELTVCLHERGAGGAPGRQSGTGSAHARSDENNNNRVEGSWLADANGRPLALRCFELVLSLS